jgi:hypothetical protein
MALLFVDMLGVKARWHTGGRESAEKAFSDFRSIIRDAIEREGVHKIVNGAIESDSAALICNSVKSAILIGRSAFQIAFCRSWDSNDERIWLRGVIVAANASDNLRTDQPLASNLPQVKVSEYSPSLLDAIASEKSGFKGMRLLIGGGITGHAIRREYRIKVNDREICPAVRLQSPPYPERLKDGYRDVLWMASELEHQQEELLMHMQNRFRWSASNAEEFAHAAVTQILFHRCSLFFASIRRRAEGLNTANA